MLKLNPFMNKKPPSISNKMDSIQSTLMNKNYVLSGMVSKPNTPRPDTPKTQFGL